MKYKTILILTILFSLAMPIQGQNAIEEDDTDTLIVTNPDEWPYYKEPGDYYSKYITNILLKKIPEFLPYPAHIRFRFVIEPDGTLSSVDVRQGGTDDMAKYIKEIIPTMTGWVPAIKDGKKVRCKLFYSAYFDPPY